MYVTSRQKQGECTVPRISQNEGLGSDPLRSRGRQGPLEMYERARAPMVSGQACFQNALRIEPKYGLAKQALDSLRRNYNVGLAFRRKQMRFSHVRFPDQFCSLCHHSLSDLQRPSSSRVIKKMPSSLVCSPCGIIRNDAHHRAMPASWVTARTSYPNWMSRSVWATWDQ